MKLLIALFLITNFNTSNAGIEYTVSSSVPSFGLNPVPPPIANENFYLLSPDSGCYTTDYTVDPEVYVDVSGNDVRVFFKAGLGGSTSCVTPTPPRYLSRAEINGLSAGTYTLSTYAIPFTDDFPPIVADYPDYFTGSFQFGVINGPISVDSNTNLALLILIALMLMTSFSCYRKKPNLNNK